MDDMNAFDQQLANTVLRRVGSSEPVDDLAIFSDITTAAQSPIRRFQSMFSATKYVLAGAIVALFGGLLLSGVLTQPVSDGPIPAAATQAPSTAEYTSSAELLPGVDLVTEEVEPGVFRVVSDGMRDLSGSAVFGGPHVSTRGSSDAGIVAGLDRSIWWLGGDGSFRLGEERVYSTADLSGIGEVGKGIESIEVGPDGTMWALSRDDLQSFDGESWTTRRTGPANGLIGGVVVQQTGTVWLAEKARKHNGDSWRVVRLGADGWEELPGQLQKLNRVEMAIAEDGGNELWVKGPGAQMQRHDGSGWSAQSVPKTLLRRPDLQRPLDAAVSPGGKTLWVLLRSGTELARFDGSDWEVYDVPEGGGLLEAARGGSVWFNPLESSAFGCDGVANVNGDTTTFFLEDFCVYAMDVAPDGSVWLQAAEDHGDAGLSTTGVVTVPVRTYVITPDATIASE